MPVSELSRIDRPALEHHLLALDPHDRRLRFGTLLSDTALRAYAARIDFDRDALFGVFDEELAVVGAVHLAHAGKHAELGVSVLREHRNSGVGGALLARAVMRARNLGVTTLFTHCLRENRTIMHLARRERMRIITEQGEAQAWLALPPADAASHFGEVFAQRAALFDYALKSTVAAVTRR